MNMLSELLKVSGVERFKKGVEKKLSLYSSNLSASSKGRQTLKNKQKKLIGGFYAAL